MSLGEIILLWMIGLIIFGACSIAIVRYVAACRRQRCDDQSAQESRRTDAYQSDSHSLPLPQGFVI